jgi:hypothetical protein
VQRAAGTYQVVTFSACYGIGAAAADKIVVAVPALQGLVATLGAEGTIDFLAADESICTRLLWQGVVSSPTKERIVASPANEVVGPVGPT